MFFASDYFAELYLAVADVVVRKHVLVVEFELQELLFLKEVLNRESRRKIGVEVVINCFRLAKRRPVLRVAVADENLAEGVGLCENVKVLELSGRDKELYLARGLVNIFERRKNLHI